MVFGLIVSTVALVVSVVAASYARRAARAAERGAVATERAATANERSALTGNIIAELERDRRHNELTPRLRIRCYPTNPGSDTYKLTIKIVGPIGLDGLDELVVTIRDDHPGRKHSTALAGGPTAEEIADQIWSPLRFMPGTGPRASSSRGVPGADPTGRTTPASGLSADEELPFFLEPTLPPKWYEQTFQDWLTERGNVLRLTFQCRKGTASWTVVGEIDFQTDNPVVVPAIT